MGLEGVCEASTHVEVLGVQHLLIGVPLSECLADFLEEGEGDFILECSVSHADKHKNPILEDVEVIPALQQMYSPL